MSEELCGRLIKHRGGGTDPCARAFGHKGRCHDLATREAQREAMRGKYAADPESERQRRRQDYWSDPEKNRARCRQWQKDNYDSWLESQRQRQKERRDYWAAIVDAHKLERGCSRCGYNEHPAALDLDHIDRSLKLDNVSRLVRLLNPKNPEHYRRMLAEIAKCQVLCSNCHRIKTVEQGDNRRKACATEVPLVP